jgi:hypothetical protein
MRTLKTCNKARNYCVESYIENKPEKRINLYDYRLRKETTFEEN